jgi:glycerophosphoryl diester phosphodiesterase
MSRTGITISLSAFAVAAGAGVYLLNASWLAPAPSGRPTVIAQRGLHQVYGREGVDDETCTARRIPPPSHRVIDNTLPSIDAAFALGADVVEIDVKLTKDREFVLFHDDALECRTDGTGRVMERTLAELKTLDVGYGYTADEGKTFPLRGSGLAEWSRLRFFGAARALSRLKSLEPDALIWSASGTAHCASGYLALGWMGHIPKACDGGVIMVPITQSAFVWGWPNRFLARMRSHATEVMLIGRVDGLSGANFSRLDTADEVARLPPGFSGSIWTDRIDVVGPALMRGH